MIRLTISGPPRTKKNSGRIVNGGKNRRFRILPSAAWSEWAEKAVLELATQTRKMRQSFPLLESYNCEALFYREAARGDAVGFYQGLADVLEKAGVVADDRQLTSWDGSRLLKDSENPRVEVTITLVGA